MAKIEEIILAISFSFPHKVEQGRASYMQRSSFHSTTVQRGRRNKIPYVPFEALKARDSRLEPVPHLCLPPIPPQSMVRRSKQSKALRKKHLGFYTSSSSECTRCELQTLEMKFPKVCLRLERSETLAQTGTAITTRMKKSQVFRRATLFILFDCLLFYFNTF